MVLIASGACPTNVPGRRPHHRLSRTLPLRERRHGLAARRGRGRSRRVVAAGRGDRAARRWPGWSSWALSWAERRAREPIVPLRLFGNRMVLAALVTGFLSGMAMFGAISFVPLFMQAVLGTSATAAGFVLTPFVLGWVSMSVTSARLVLRLGLPEPRGGGHGVPHRGLPVLHHAGRSRSRQAAAMAHALLAGIGMGLVFVPMLIAAQSAVPRDDLGARPR